MYTFNLLLSPVHFIFLVCLCHFIPTTIVAYLIYAYFFYCWLLCFYFIFSITIYPPSTLFHLHPPFSPQQSITTPLPMSMCPFSIFAQSLPTPTPTPAVSLLSSCLLTGLSWEIVFPNVYYNILYALLTGKFFWDMIYMI